MYQLLVYLVLKLKFFGKNIHFDRTSFIASNCKMKIIDSGSITIGKNCEIYDYIIIATFGGDIKIGDNSSINPFSVTYGNGSLNFGNCMRIAAHTVIITANHKFEDIEVPIHLQGETRVGITIEDDIWIGAGSKILDGVTIGKGSVIGLPPGAYSACLF